MRLFAALPEVALTQEQESGLREHLGRVPGLRPAASRHITLAFLGECDEAQALRAARVLSEVAVRHAPFDAALDRLMGLPNSRGARVAVLAGDAPEPLDRLARDIRKTLRQHNVQCDPKRFLLHMTVGRMRAPTPFPEAGFGPVPFHAEEFHLMQSELSPRGARHARMASYRLSEW